MKKSIYSVFFSFVFRNRAAVSLFWDLWATQIEDLGFEHDIQGVQNWFLLQTTTFYTLALKILSFNVSIMKKFKKMFIGEAFSS